MDDHYWIFLRRNFLWWFCSESTLALVVDVSSLFPVPSALWSVLILCSIQKKFVKDAYKWAYWSTRQCRCTKTWSTVLRTRNFRIHSLHFFSLSNLRSHLFGSFDSVAAFAPPRIPAAPAHLRKSLFLFHPLSTFSMFRIIKAKYFENFLLGVNNGVEKAFNSFERIVILRTRNRLYRLPP